jgi:hypothetical protein
MKEKGWMGRKGYAEREGKNVWRMGMGMDLGGGRC